MDRTMVRVTAGCIVCLGLLTGLATRSSPADKSKSKPADGAKSKPAVKLPKPPAGIPNAAMHSRECVVCHEEIADLLKGDKHIADDLHCVVCHGRSKAHLEMKEEGTLPDRAWRRWIEEENGFKWRMKNASLEIAKLCASCHGRKPPKGKKIKAIDWRDYLETEHGRAVAKGERDAPTCTDCHYAHGAGSEPLTDKTIVQRCSLCHADKEMMKRAGLDPNVIRDFKAVSPKEKSSCIKCHAPH
jgi:predicted CXXCH cytochrome family protein